MKNIYFLAVLFLISNYNFSQMKAVTEIGDTVLLFEDGTWKYVDETIIENAEIPMNPKPFSKNENASFLLKSSKVNLGFWINPKKWKFQKAVDNEDAEYELQLKLGDLYGTIITEKLEIPIITLKNIVLENGKAVAPDIKIIKEEYRIVNNIKILLLLMNGTMQGIKFTYYGYYFSNKNGTVQFITYTSQNLIEEYLPEIEELLNGLVEI